MSKFILFICILFPVTSRSQYVGAKHIGSDGVPRNLEITNITGEPIPIGNHSNIDGTPLLQGKLAFAVLILKNGRTYSDSLVGYSLFDDKLFIKRNNRTYPINYPVREFLLENVEESSERKVYHFQNGFPAINGIKKNDSLTFYEVLFGGNYVKLLKWKHKKIKEIYAYASTFKSEYFLVEDFFVFFPKTNKIVELGIKVNINVLSKYLPEYSNQINAYTSSHKLNWKNDDDLIQLFSFLDSANLY